MVIDELLQGECGLAEELKASRGSALGRPPAFMGFDPQGPPHSYGEDWRKIFCFDTGEVEYS